MFDSQSVKLGIRNRGRFVRTVPWCPVEGPLRRHMVPTPRASVRLKLCRFRFRMRRCRRPRRFRRGRDAGRPVMGCRGRFGERRFCWLRRFCCGRWRFRWWFCAGRSWRRRRTDVWSVIAAQNLNEQLNQRQTMAHQPLLRLYPQPFSWVCSSLLRPQT